MINLLMSQPVWIPPTDPHIAYIGRFDLSDKSAAVCEWSASEVRLKVHGKSVTFAIDDANGCAWEEVVDGKDLGQLNLKKGADQYTVDLQTNADHEVSLVRRVEAFMGTTKFTGFRVMGRLLSAKPRKHLIEVVGDSITCGYGNEGKNQNEHFMPETENAYESYASVGARKLNADVNIIAWSGRKMWPDNTVPAIYDSILPTDPKSTYSFRGRRPDAVLINLATNDFGRAVPDEKKWTEAYEDFVRRVWSHYPGVQIYICSGSMMNGPSLNILKGYLEKIQNDLSDPKVHILNFDPQKAEDGFGSDWHPSVVTDEKMGAKLADTLRADLGW